MLNESQLSFVQGDSSVERAPASDKPSLDVLKEASKNLVKALRQAQGANANWRITGEVEQSLVHVKAKIAELERKVLLDAQGRAESRAEFADTASSSFLPY